LQRLLRFHFIGVQPTNYMELCRCAPTRLHTCGPIGAPTMCLHLHVHLPGEPTPAPTRAPIHLHLPINMCCNCTFQCKFANPDAHTAKPSTMVPSHAPARAQALQLHHVEIHRGTSNFNCKARAPDLMKLRTFAEKSRLLK